MLYIEPYAGSTPVTSIIDAARHTIVMNVYFLSSNAVLNAIAKANSRGVSVSVIIDGKPYGMSSSSVNTEIRKIRSTGAMLKVAPSRFESYGHHYAFDHAKYVCNGHKCEIGTANFDYSAFHRNREYLYVTKNTAVVAAARTVFNADWNNQRAGNFPRQKLVLSPYSSQTILQVLTQAGPVYIESEELGSDKEILNAIAHKGKNAWLIVPSSLSTKDKQNCNKLAAYGVHIAYMPNSVYMHAKMITGNLFAFIGSENFSYTSLNKNREMGIILGGNSIQELHAQFHKDWAIASGGTNSNGFMDKLKNFAHW